jgi:thiol:disulfide interchange protein DsbC
MVRKSIILSGAVTLLLGVSFNLNASDISQKLNKNEKNKAEQKHELKPKDDYILKAIKSVIPNTSIAKYGKSLIDGFYEVYFKNGQIIYVNPFKRLIFFGEIWNDRGYSFTATDRQNWIKKLKDESDKKVATLNSDKLLNFAEKITFGNKKIADSQKYEFVIFTDPDCPYCKRAENYFRGKDINLYVNYMPLSMHPNAKEKSLKILSANDFKKTFLDYIDSKLDLNKIIITEKARKKLDNIQRVIKDLKVQEATPQIYVINQKNKKVVSLIRGADLKSIDKFLNEK